MGRTEGGEVQVEEHDIARENGKGRTEGGEVQVENMT